MEQSPEPLPYVPPPPMVPPDASFIERHGIHPALFVLICLFVLLILYQGIPTIVTLLIFGIHLDPKFQYVTPDNVGWWRALTGAGQILLLLIPTLLLTRLATRQPAAFLRVRRPSAGAVVLPLLGILSLQQALQFYLAIQERIPLPSAIEEFNRQFKDAYEGMAKMLTASSSVPELIWVIVVISVIPAIAEEFLFRGLVQRSLEKAMRPLMAAVVTGILFGAYHLNPFSLIPLAVLGGYLGFVAMRADSIWVSVAAHFYNNTIACISVYMIGDEDTFVTGDPKSLSLPELFGLMIAFTLVFLGVTYLFVLATKKGRPDGGPPSAQEEAAA